MNEEFFRKTRTKVDHKNVSQWLKISFLEGIRKTVGRKREVFGEM